MAAGSHFVIKKNQSYVLIWNGEKCDRKRFSVSGNQFVKNKKVGYLSEMARNAIKSDLW